VPSKMATRETLRTGVLVSLFARSAGDVQYCGQEVINSLSPITGYIGMAVQALVVLTCIIKDGEDGPAEKSGLPNSKIPWRKSRLFAKRLQAWCATAMSSRWKASRI